MLRIGSGPSSVRSPRARATSPRVSTIVCWSALSPQCSASAQSVCPGEFTTGIRGRLTPSRSPGPPDESAIINEWRPATNALDGDGPASAHCRGEAQSLMISQQVASSSYRSCGYSCHRCRYHCPCCFYLRHWWWGFCFHSMFVTNIGTAIRLRLRRVQNVSIVTASGLLGDQLTCYDKSNQSIICTSIDNCVIIRALLL